METSHLPACDYRPGEGPTLVFLHYWGGAARTWQPVIERLPGRGTLAVEARGWGRSRSLPGLYTCGSSPRTRTTSSPTPGSASTSWWAIPWAEGGPARRRHASGRAHRARARRARPGAARGRRHPRVPASFGQGLRNRRNHGRRPRHRPHRHPAHRGTQGPDRGRLASIASNRPKCSGTTWCPTWETPASGSSPAAATWCRRKHRPNSRGSSERSDRPHRSR
jgi:hypothetical protein